MHQAHVKSPGTIPYLGQDFVVMLGNSWYLILGLLSLLLALGIMVVEGRLDLHQYPHRQEWTRHGTYLRFELLREISQHLFSQLPGHKGPKLRCHCELRVEILDQAPRRSSLSKRIAVGSKI